MATTRATFEFLALLFDLPDGVSIADVEVTEMDDEHRVLTLHLEGGELEDDTEYALHYQIHHGLPQLVSIEPVNTESS